MKICNKLIDRPNPPEKKIQGSVLKLFIICKPFLISYSIPIIKIYYEFNSSSNNIMNNSFVNIESIDCEEICPTIIADYQPLTTLGSDVDCMKMLL